MNKWYEYYTETCLNWALFRVYTKSISFTLRVQFVEVPCFMKVLESPVCRGTMSYVSPWEYIPTTFISSLYHVCYCLLYRIKLHCGNMFMILFTVRDKLFINKWWEKSLVFLIFPFLLCFEIAVSKQCVTGHS